MTIAEELELLSAGVSAIADIIERLRSAGAGETDPKDVLAKLQSFTSASTTLNAKDDADAETALDKKFDPGGL